MRRKTFDALLTMVGLVLTVILLAAGGLLLWAHNFTHNQVTDQLTAQQIYFPESGSDSISGLPEGDQAAIEKYAGQQLTTGAQAEAYANHYINAHLQAIGGGKTYSQLSEESRANPDDADLAATVNTVFKGETLRGLLLNAYAFDTMATVAGIAAIGAFIGAAVMALLTVLGFVHMRRVSADEDVKLGGGAPVAVTA
jgi:hypothetical protein